MRIEKPRTSEGDRLKQNLQAKGARLLCQVHDNLSPCSKVSSSPTRRGRWPRLSRGSCDRQIAHVWATEVCCLKSPIRPLCIG